VTLPGTASVSQSGLVSDSVHVAIPVRPHRAEAPGRDTQRVDSPAQKSIVSRYTNGTSVRRPLIGRECFWTLSLTARSRRGGVPIADPATKRPRSESTDQASADQHDDRWPRRKPWPRSTPVSQARTASVRLARRPAQRTPPDAGPAWSAPQSRPTPRTRPRRPRTRRRPPARVA
jgi:hypothetical protein